MKKRKMLNVVRGEDERVEISPVIRYVVNARVPGAFAGGISRLATEARRLNASGWIRRQATSPIRTAMTMSELR